MKPDISTLLDDLTGARPDAADSLIHAVRRHRRRKAQRRVLTVSALSIAAIMAGMRLLPRESSAPVAGVAPPPSRMLTQNELLDSFGDQPVALITWPDGRQQLLAFAHAPARTSAR